MALPSYVGRYKVCEEIATGGLASVVQAWDEELESFVAIKILLPGLTGDETLRSRFMQEARLLRRMRCAHVITVHDVGRLDDGRPYFVMDFADRGTLADRVRSLAREAADPQEVGVLVDALADGLAAIHEAGVVHRDIKPANILFQSAQRWTSDRQAEPANGKASGSRLVEIDERILVGDLGIAKDVAETPALTTLIGGTPLYQAPEQIEAGRDVTPATDIYAATAVLWNVLTGRSPPSPGTARSRLATLPSAWHHLIEQGLDSDPEARFTTIENWRSAIHDVLAHEVAAVQSDLPTEVISEASSCPYKGLAAYQPEDSQCFFGREALVDELVRRLQLRRVLVVGGPSGSGKSSLVRAGLIPALSAGALPGSESWRSVLFTPGRDPMAELYYGIAEALPNGRPTLSLEELLARPTLARHLSRTGTAKQPLLLCIDQFEEVFTLAPPSHLETFVTALSAMTDPADSLIRVVLAVRADFYGVCAQIPWLAERITANQMLVGPMTGSELRRAISEPARRSGLYVERNLIEEITDQAGEEAGSLPLVAHALVETWLRRQGNTLTIEGFRKAGGVAGAISQTADATYEQSFDTLEREATKRLFLRLVTPGEGTPDTRRSLARSDIDQDSEPQVMQQVVERLTEARLLTLDEQSVQIAHEALLRTWPRLRVWIEESRDDLRMRQRIARAAAEWEAAGRDQDLLYRGTPLLSALEWRARNPDHLGGLELTFLEASTAAKAQAEAVDGERRRRASRLRRLVVSVLSGLAVGASAASVVAFLALREAKQNEREAELATAVATERFAAALGAAAKGLVETDPLLALLLGAEAAARAVSAPPSYDARAAMLAARPALTGNGPFLLGSPIPAGDALAIALSPDGALLATGLRNGSIDLVETATGLRVGPDLQGHNGGVEDLAFSPDGRKLASVGDDGAIRLWTVDDGQSKHRFDVEQVGETADVVWDVAFGPGGKILASASEDGTVRLWDLSRAGPPPPPLIDRMSDFLSVAFTPDGDGLLAGNGDGEIYGWRLPSGAPLFGPVRGAHTSDIWELAFSPLGNRFATASSDGRAMLLDYPSGRILGPAFDGVERIESVAFASGGMTLIGGGSDGSLHLWDIQAERPLLSTPNGHSQGIIDIELSRDGRLLATLGRDQLIRLWRFDTAHPLARTWAVAGRAAKGLAISSDGDRLAAGDDRGGVSIWSLRSEEAPLRLSGHTHQVWALAFSPGGDLLASADRNGEIRLWNASSGARLWSSSTSETAVWSLVFSTDGRQLLVADDSGLDLRSVDSGELERRFQQRVGSRITRAALAPDGDLVALAASDGTVSLWDLERAALTQELQAADDLLWSAVFSPDGRQLATASSDEVVAVWNTRNGQRLRALTGHSGGATDLAFLADGVTLVVTDRRGRLHWWDVPSGRRLARSQQAHEGTSWRIALHPDGERFATAGDDGRVKLWDGLSRREACRIGSRAFDRVRREQYLGIGERAVACE